LQVRADPRNLPAMRIAVYILAAIQIGLFTVYSLGRPMPEARTIDAGFDAMMVLMVGGVMAIFLIPAVIVAISGRELWLALILALAPPVLYLLVIGLRGF